LISNYGIPEIDDLLDYIDSIPDDNGVFRYELDTSEHILVLEALQELKGTYK
jgi:hypothetical protein